jgi:hypothetical protein
VCTATIQVCTKVDAPPNAAICPALTESIRENVQQWSYWSGIGNLDKVHCFVVAASRSWGARLDGCD